MPCEFLQIFAQRQHSLHCVLKYEDELFALLAFFLDKQSLGNSSSMFADGLYGLRRAPHRNGVEKPQVLDRQQQMLALFMQVDTVGFAYCSMHTAPVPSSVTSQVALPYLQAKVRKLYEVGLGTADNQGLVHAPSPRSGVPQASQAQAEKALYR